MSKGGRGICVTCAAAVASVMVAVGSAGTAVADEDIRRALTGPNGTVAVETVYFADPRLKPVALVRGMPRPAPAALRSLPAPPASAPAQNTQIVSFGSGFAEQVKVIRGGSFGSPGPMPGRKVAFADSRRTVSAALGPAVRELFAVDLFGPAKIGELDRIAFAVEGVESRHGLDPGMWRQSLTAAQGPMQVTAAAAFDVGGGDRFDLYQNRLLGRAYLAQMYQRYGNWPDALAAYNWGPGSVDAWIAGGRLVEQLPTGVAYYVARVLRDTLVSSAR